MIERIVAEALPSIGRGFVRLEILQIATAVVAYLAIRLTPGARRARTAILLLVTAAYHVGVWRWLDGPTVMNMALFFVWLHLGFVCRLLSSIYYYRRGQSGPTLPFYVVMLTWAPRQHYGAGTWAELGGERFSAKLLRQWSVHTLYGLAVIAVAGGLMALALSRPMPFRGVVVRGMWFAMGLELLAICANLQTMAWSLAGHHRTFFGRFAWIRSRHIGQWWQNWNRVAIVAFAELSAFLGLRRHFFLNCVAVFFVSGLLHETLVAYCIRRAAYGTVLAFLIHGLLVWGFETASYRLRSRWPLLRLLIFNPVTNAVVVIAASQTFVLDFYGRYLLPLARR